MGKFFMALHHTKICLLVGFVEMKLKHDAFIIFLLKGTKETL